MNYLNINEECHRESGGIFLNIMTINYYVYVDEMVKFENNYIFFWKMVLILDGGLL